MNDLRPDTLDALEVRASRRIGLISLGLVTGGLVVAMALAIATKESDEAATKSADCQRSERTVAATKTSQHAKPETLLLCASGSSFLKKIF